MDKERGKAHLVMTLLLVIWGSEYIAVKYAQESFNTESIIFLKYLFGIVIVFIIKCKVDPKGRFRKKDIPVLIACVIMGEIMYFFSEYKAMDYIPVALITIILAFVPAMSILIERIAFKKRATWKMKTGVITSIMGIVLVIGTDFSLLLHGRAMGYFLSFLAVLAWNGYNFFTHRISDSYTGSTLTFNQILCTILLILPIGIRGLIQIEEVKAISFVSVVYIGIFSAGIGFFLYVWCLKRLGPTVTAVYSNFLPVTTAFLGFVLLSEKISVLQILGGLIVIGSGYLIIRERGKLEEKSDD